MWICSWRWDACTRLLFLLGLMYPPELLRVVARWKDDLSKISPVAAQALADLINILGDFLTYCCSRG